MAQAAHGALRCLLAAAGHQAELDEEIVEYISSILHDPDPDSCVETLVEVIASAVTSFSSLSNEKQVAMVLQLLEQVQTTRVQQDNTSSNAANDLDTVMIAFKQATLLSHQQACSDITNTVCISSNSLSSAHSVVQGPDVSGLVELCPPDISQEYLSHMVQHTFRGDLQAAADYLFECPDIHEQQHNWLQELEQQEEQRLEAEQEKKHSKKQIVDRFDLQVVPELAKKTKYGADILPGPRSAAQQPKVRYRDGRIVSSKGEKYIVEKVGEEWDGGSRGKVYTKGKRGKGFT